MKNDNKVEMAWNDPGKNDNPWGNNNDKQNNNGRQGGVPPDIDEIINKIKDQFSKIFGGGNKGGNSGKSNGNSLALIVFVIFLVVWILSGIYIVGPAGRGVVLRFGEHVDTTTAGPHWHMPYPIETAIIVDVDNSRDITIGYRDSSLGSEVLNESLMLTKDENIINAKFAVQYKIKNPENYLFSLSDPTATLRQVTESAIREVVGKSKMDFILTSGRAEVVAKIENIVQKVLDGYKSGIIVTQVTMKDAQPPEQVQEAFADVVKAQEDNRKFINQAEAYRNDILPKARGKVARIIAEANAYKDQILAKAQGETSRFDQILTEYKKAPSVTRKRMYIDTMQDILSRTGKIMIDDKVKGNSLMMLPVDKLVAGATSVYDNQQITQQSNNQNDKKTRNLRGSR